MILSHKSVITVLIMLFIFSLALIINCAGPEPESVERPTFVGRWHIEETRTGCGKENELFEYDAEITLNKHIFSIGRIRKKDNFTFTCKLNADHELDCDGNIRDSDGNYSYGSNNYSLWFPDGDDENELMGTGEWTWDPDDLNDNEDNCNGDSSITARRL